MVRLTSSFLIVTKPTGEVVKRPIDLKYDDSNGLIEVVFLGDTPLRGYEFAILNTEVDRVRAYGQPIDGT